MGDRYDQYEVLAIDEGQFFSDLADFVTQAADVHHKEVLVAGLDGDFKRRRCAPRWTADSLAENRCALRF